MLSDHYTSLFVNVGDKMVRGNSTVQLYKWGLYKWGTSINGEGGTLIFKELLSPCKMNSINGGNGEIPTKYL